MPRFAANLSFMYNQHAFLDRFNAAARDGFRAVEYMFPYDFPAEEIRTRLEVAGLTQVLFNAPPGDWSADERGIASLPGREDEFKRSIDIALAYARVIGCRSLHVMAGVIAPEQDPAAHRAVYLSNLAHAAQAAAADDVVVTIEPINRRDMPGYFLNRQDEAQAVCREIGAPNLKVQFDCYHCQIVEGDLSVKLKRDIANIGHIQIAGVPDRHEPDLGELNYRHLFELIDMLGYDGWIGCEYRPKDDTSSGLGWLKPYL